ncbi:heavy metal transporter [Enterovirga aerilata]|uniref:Heavy metal transporter n=1 Tax=Enterovirga aerilata TaxID=2730920 RepID=A0A849I573_9HYPH|nr:heavy metal transporter [Enterovirga sp. DB1703]NNM72481.1 heavy metal transporter [Enterovirga sp. DB1703]
MSDELREIETRVDGVTRPDCLAPIEAAIRSLDPEARVRFDPATGIVHALTRRDTLEIVAALSGAGIEAKAMTL